MADKQAQGGVFASWPGGGKHFRFFLGKLKKFPAEEKKFFELAMPEEAERCKSYFSPFEFVSPVRSSDQSDGNNKRLTRPGKYFQAVEAGNQPQTYPQWKVQTDFRKLNWRQRKRMRQKVIYILPIGPFPDFINETLKETKYTLFEVIQRFVGLYFLGMAVQTLEPVNILDIKCKTRIHHLTKQQQVFIGDVQSHLKERLPKDGYCILGLTWVDLYPSEDLNFILGEAQCDNGCAAVCFGHYEPQQYTTDITSKEKSNYVESVFETSLITDANNKMLQDNTQETQNVFMNNQTTVENNIMIVDNLDDSKPATNAESEKSGSWLKDTLNACRHVESEPRNLDIYSKNHHQESHSETHTKSCDDNDLLCLSSFGRINKIDGNLLWRMFRAVSHELCHMFGMGHCWYFSCAMNSSSSIQQAESQPLFLCPICLRKLQEALGFCLLMRYQALLNFFTLLRQGLCGAQDNTNYGVKIGKRDTEGQASDNRVTDGEEWKFRESTEWLHSVTRFISSGCT